MKPSLESQKSDIENTEYFQTLLKDIHKMIEESRQKAAVTVNAALSILYWQIGNRINKDILDEKRAAYGERILPTLSAKLMPKFGNGFSSRNLSTP